MIEVTWLKYQPEPLEVVRTLFTLADSWIRQFSFVRGENSLAVLADVNYVPIPPLGMCHQLCIYHPSNNTGLYYRM